MEREQNMMSLADALRNGDNPDEIRAGFEAALQAAQNEVAAEQAAKAENKCAGNCNGCTECAEEYLDETREEMIYAVLDYLTALGLISEDMEITDEDVEHLNEAIKEIETEFRAKIGFLKMLSDLADMKAAMTTPEKVPEKKVERKIATADDIIAQFLKGLH